jgi:mRNA interferase RelE/StbE
LSWTIDISSGAERQLRKLDRSTARRLVAYLNQLVAETDDPRLRGKGLSGPLAGLWRYRVGDHRIICQLLDDRLIVLVVRLGHRSRVYE